MAVQVIGENKQAFREATCRNCAAVLQYTLSDVQSRTVRDYGGGSDEKRFIICPRCGCEVGAQP